MQLSDILEEHSLKNISKKTNISEENIENILEKKFEKIDRVKAMGFLSIIEREFRADLGELRSEAQAYYAEHDTVDRGVVVGVPFSLEKRGKSKSLFIIVFILLAAASWYFLTQYDKTHFNALQPHNNEEVIAKDTESEGVSQEEVDIMQAIKQKWKNIVNDEKKEGLTSDSSVETEMQSAIESVDEMVEPVDADTQKPEETNVARVADEQEE